MLKKKSFLGKGEIRFRQQGGYMAVRKKKKVTKKRVAKRKPAKKKVLKRKAVKKTKRAPRRKKARAPKMKESCTCGEAPVQE